MDPVTANGWGHHELTTHCAKSSTEFLKSRVGGKPRPVAPLGLTCGSCCEFCTRSACCAIFESSCTHITWRRTLMRPRRDDCCPAGALAVWKEDAAGATRDEDAAEDDTEEVEESSSSWYRDGGNIIVRPLRFGAGAGGTNFRRPPCSGGVLGACMASSCRRSASAYSAADGLQKDTTQVHTYGILGAPTCDPTPACGDPPNEDGPPEAEDIVTDPLLEACALVEADTGGVVDPTKASTSVFFRKNIRCWVTRTVHPFRGWPPPRVRTR